MIKKEKLLNDENNKKQKIKEERRKIYINAN